MGDITKAGASTYLFFWLSILAQSFGANEHVELAGKLHQKTSGCWGQSILVDPKDVGAGIIHARSHRLSITRVEDPHTTLSTRDQWQKGSRSKSDAGQAPLVGDKDFLESTDTAERQQPVLVIQQVCMCVSI
jgi:hypothetical protein